MFLTVLPAAGLVGAASFMPYILNKHKIERYKLDSWYDSVPKDVIINEAREYVRNLAEKENKETNKSK